MKKLYALCVSLATVVSVEAQVVFSSSFENWSGGAPIDWVGSKTTLEDDSIIQITSGTMYGSNAVQLVNTESTHKRFTTEMLHTDSGSTYNIKMWAKGSGHVRTTIYDGRSSAFGYASYSTYDTLVSSPWQMLTYSFLCTHTFDSSQFVISVRSTMGNHIQVDSFVVSVDTNSAPSSLTPIYDIQYTTDLTGNSPLKDSLVSVTGIVTAVKSSGYYIQDDEAAWSGVFVYDNTNIPMVGDSITISGEVVEYNNLTELSYITDYSNHGAVSPLMPITVATSDVNSENYEGVLVKILGTCTDANTAANFGMWKVNDGSGDALVDDQIFDYVPNLNDDYAVTGVVDFSFSEYKVLPRDANDVTEITGVNEVQVSELVIYPNPVQNVLTIKTDGNAKVTLFNTLGNVVYTGSRVRTLDMSAYENGMYILEVQSNNTIVRRAFVKN